MTVSYCLSFATPLLGRRSLSLLYSGRVSPYVPHDGRQREPPVAVSVPPFVRYRGSIVGKPLLRDGRLSNFPLW
jgi:hypothetical protein